MIYRALGLMSGTSLDAIDVAFIETDGVSHASFRAAESFSYDKEFREQLRACFGKRSGRSDPHVAWAEQELTKRHAHAVNAFLQHHFLSSQDVDIIGFHGQTIWHDPSKGETIQIGDGTLLAQLTKIDVVDDFRTSDVKAGGQGAPLVPLYHRALAEKLPKPTAIVNIGGVSNMTWLGGSGDDEILSFDTGPGNALLDDWILDKIGKTYDEGGALASSGRVDSSYMELFLHHPFFEKKPPKSLDRSAFMNFVPKGLSLEDGAATLAMMTAQSIVEGLRHVPKKPSSLYVTGGGRLNAALMNFLAERVGRDVLVASVDDLGWRGDSMEAEAFAYLAVRSVLGFPLTLPRTTAVPQPMTGGVLHKVR